MIVDTSAIMALVFGEPDHALYSACLARNPGSGIAAPNWLEATMVVEGRGDTAATAELQALLDEGWLSVVAFEPAHAEAARHAWRRFGKGRHPAALNYGDCMAYAVASNAGVPLLYKGNDFSRTDIGSALAA